MALALLTGSAKGPSPVLNLRAGLGRVLGGLAFGLALLAGIPASAAPFEILSPAEKPDGRDRFALVIGNANYRNVPSLRNPVNDAEAMGGRLNRLGFEVTLARDLDRRATNETVDVFLARLTPGADVVVYFAGHGVEVQGANQLLPVDVPKIQAGQDRVLRSETTNLTDLMADLRDKAPRALVMILDACRDNPFAGEGTRSIGSARGLARVEPPKGSLVIYSAGVGERALDNLGEGDPSPNGLFTRTLLRQMDEEGLEVRDLVRRTRNEVREAALRAGGHSQTPGYYDELLDSFFFRPKPATDPNVAFCERNAEPEADPLAVLRRNLEPVTQACGRALRAKPGDEGLSRLIRAVNEQRAFQTALNADTPDAALFYLALFPQGRFAASVGDHLKRVGRDGDVAVAIPGPPDPVRQSRRIETEPQAVPAAPSTPPAAAASTPAAVPVASLAPKPDPVRPVVPGAPASGTPFSDPDPEEDGRETMARQLQDELKRVGCFSGAADGRWGERARRALASFNRAAGTGLPVDNPRRESVEAVQLHADRVCPVSCGVGQRPNDEGDACQRVACRRGERLSEDGTCAAPAVARRAEPPAPRIARPEPRPEPARASRPEPRPEPARAARPEPRPELKRETAREAAAPKAVPRSLAPAPREVEAPPRRAQPRAVPEPPPARLVRRVPPPRRAPEPEPEVVYPDPPPAPRPRIGIGIGGGGGIGIGIGGGRFGGGGIGIGF